MISQFQFSNLCGPFYKSGQLVFNNKKNILYSPIGNKIKIIDLESNQSSTLSLETRSDVHNLALSPDNKILIAVDIDGYAIIINLLSRVVLSHFNFKSKVNALKFSPNNKFLAICSGTTFKIFEAPQLFKSFESLVLYKKFKGVHTDDIFGLEWSPDSRFLVTYGKDLRARMNSIHKLEDYLPYTFAVHKYTIKNCFFSQNMNYFYTIDKMATICAWKWTDENITENYLKFKNMQMNRGGKKIKLDQKKSKNVYQGIESEDESEVEENKNEAEKLEKQAKDLQNVNVNDNEEKEKKITENYTPKDENLFKSEFEGKVSKGRYFLAKKEKFFQKQFAKIKVCEYHQQQGLLVIGFSNGNYSLYKIRDDEFTLIQQFSVSQQSISSISINFSGSWIAIGLKKLGQLMVWEWRSQSYILNQQCLSYDITSCAYSPDGAVLASGSRQGKIKLFDTKSNLCFSTLTDHQSEISDIAFSSRANTVISCSLDGTVRCWDTQRFKCFRVLKPDIACQFTAVAVDASGEVVCAGGIDPYDIYSWNIQTGNLLEVISGHEGPITSLFFSPIQNILISSSWDKSIRVHDIFSRKINTDVLDHNSEVTAFSIRPDGQELSVATLKGEIYLWNLKDMQIIGNIDCKKDIQGGRLQNDKMTAQNSTSNKHFRSIVYSSDGDYLLAGGNSKYICLYELRHRILLKKIRLTSNRSLDGTLHKLNSKNMKNGTNKLDLPDDHEATDSDEEKQKLDYLPGAKKFDVSKRNTKLRIECRNIKFSPSDDQWCVATTEGLMIYSKQEQSLFTPYEIDESISIVGIEQALLQQNYGGALNMGLKLNNFNINKQIYYKIPKQYIIQVIKSIPSQYIQIFLDFIVQLLEQDGSVELHFHWIENILFIFNDYFKSLGISSSAILKGLLKQLNQKFTQFQKVTAQNVYTLQYLLSNMEINVKKQE